MRCLTLHRPWPAFIFGLGGDSWKQIENRSWKPPDSAVGTRIAIHAGRAFDDSAVERVKPWLWEWEDTQGLRDEGVVGTVLAAGGRREEAFLATKVWTDGEAAGRRQMQQSCERMHTDVIDLMQVHNLRDLDTHFATIRDWQADARIRYSGLTHYRAAALDDMATAMRRYRPQFIQINYSLGEREADTRVLPLARDLGIAVLINRPYMAGRLFARVRGRPLPDWATGFANSWGQFFLKYIVAHDAVTCVIPATGDPRHMLDNLGAGSGPLPDTATRARMVRFFDAL